VAVVVVGGHSRSVGKTSLVAGLISALPELHWTAVKVTQFGHGFCSQDGKPCHCATETHEWAITEERDRSGRSDSSRFLVAGAQRSLWVRTRQGALDLALPSLERRLADATNVILESNSILQYLHPDVYLTVLDPQTEDFKKTSRDFLDRASGIVLHGTNGSGARWKDVAMSDFGERPVFLISPPPYCTPEIVEFVRRKIAG
jgi:hypothetical protein